MHRTGKPEQAADLHFHQTNVNFVKKSPSQSGSFRVISAALLRRAVVAELVDAQR